MHEDIIKMCLHMFGESLPVLDGLLLKSPPCLVFTPSFCKAAWGTSCPRDPRCIELVTLRAGLWLTFCSCPSFGYRT